MDVVARDSAGRTVNIEIQRAGRGAGSRRARFNSSMLDAALLLFRCKLACGQHPLRNALTILPFAPLSHRFHHFFHRSAHSITPFLRVLEVAAGRRTADAGHRQADTGGNRVLCRPLP